MTENRILRCSYCLVQQATYKGKAIKIYDAVFYEDFEPKFSESSKCSCGNTQFFIGRFDLVPVKVSK